MIDYNIYFNSCAVIGNELIFMALNNDFKCLMRVNISTGAKKVLFPESQNVNLFGRVASNTIVLEEKIYWVDSTFKYIIEYDISTNSIYYFKLPKLLVKDYDAITGIYYCNGFIYIIPLYSSEWILFKLSDKSIITKKIKGLYLQSSCKYKCANQYGSDMFLAGFCGKKIVKVNMLSFEIVEEIVSYIPVEIRDIRYVANKLYVLDLNGELYIVNNKKMDLIMSNQQRDYFIIEPVDENKIVLLPELRDEISIMDIGTGKITDIVYPFDFQYIESDMSKFYQYSFNDKYGCFGNRRANYSLIYNKIRREFEWLSMTIGDGEIDTFLHMNIGILHEGVVSVDRFIKTI